MKYMFWSLVCAVMVGAAVKGAVDDDIRAALRIAAEQRFEEKYSDSVIYSAGISVKTKGNAVGAIRSAIRLWIADDEQTLHLAWYEQTDRQVRAILAYLLSGAGDERRIEMTRTLEFMAGRFNEPEAEERRAELQFILRNRNELAEILIKALPPTMMSRLRSRQGVK